MTPLFLWLIACQADSDGPGDQGGPPMTVVTWNTGTTEGLGHDQPPDDGYTEAHALVSDTWYGDGLAWLPAVDAATDFLAGVDADIVVFQEIFYAGDCPDIPADAQADFFCDRWSRGDPMVAQEILGDGWQIACHPGKPDKCAAVKRSFGSFAGCDRDFCLEGLDGYGVEGCGSGARIGRGRIERADGGAPLTLVNVHGSSGLSADDRACRAKQVDQVFVNLGDGEPGANGSENLVMGDLNTDPGRWVESDESAVRWNDFVGPGHDFHFVTEVGPDAPGSYSGLADIDHVMSDSLHGSCWIAGISDGHPAVIDAVYFDHAPVVCEVR